MLVLAMGHGGRVGDARPVAHQLRDLLLSDEVAEHLLEVTNWPKMAAELHGMVKVYAEVQARLLAGESLEKIEADLDAEEREGGGSDGRGAVLDHYDFETLNRVTVHGFITLRVPARWQLHATAAGRQGYWEEGVESGTLWVDWRWIDKGEGQAPDGENRALPGVPPDTVLTKREGGVEEGEIICFYSWHRFLADRRGLLVVHVNLVILAEMDGRPDFAALIDFLDSEVRQAEIGEAPPEG